MKRKVELPYVIQRKKEFFGAEGVRFNILFINIIKKYIIELFSKLYY